MAILLAPARSMAEQIHASAPSWLLGAYVAILPFPHATAFRNLFFFSLLGLTAWKLWRGELHLIVPLRRSWALYGLVAAVSVVFAVDLDYSLKEFREEIVTSVVAMCLGAIWISDRAALARLLRVLSFANLMIVMLAVVEAAATLAADGTDPLLKGISPLDMGVGKISIYVLMVLPFVFIYWRFVAHPAWRWMLWPVLSLNAAALVLSMNRMAMVVAFVAVPLFGVMVLLHKGFASQRRHVLRSLVLAMALLVAGGLAVLSAKGGGLLDSLQNDPRYAIWHHAWLMIDERPLLGGGIGRETFKNLVPDWRQRFGGGPHWHAHNLLLDRGVQMGWPGMLTFLVLIAAALKRTWPPPGADRETHLVCAATVTLIVVILLKNMTDDFFQRDVAWLFWLLVGAAISSREQVGRCHADKLAD